MKNKNKTLCARYKNKSQKRSRSNKSFGNSLSLKIKNENWFTSIKNIGGVQKLKHLNQADEKWSKTDYDSFRKSHSETVAKLQLYRWKNKAMSSSHQ